LAGSVFWGGGEPRTWKGGEPWGSGGLINTANSEKKRLKAAEFRNGPPSQLKREIKPHEGEERSRTAERYASLEILDRSPVAIVIVAVEGGFGGGTVRSRGGSYPVRERSAC